MRYSRNRRQPVNKLTLEQLQSLQLQGGTRIPTLEEVLQTAVRIQPVKPILLEIKLLHSDEARFHMLDLAKRYRDQHGLEIQFLAFIRNVSRSFDDPRQWLDRFSDAGFRVYQTYRPKTQEYDLCDTWAERFIGYRCDLWRNAGSRTERQVPSLIVGWQARLSFCEFSERGLLFPGDFVPVAKRLAKRSARPSDHRNCLPATR